MSETFVLKGGLIFDGLHAEPLRGRALVLRDGRIDAVTEESADFGDARIIDLAGRFVSPGFIDCHMHILLEEVPKDKNRALTMYSAGGEPYPNADSAVAFLGVDNCRRMLEAGFTTVMDGGGRNFIDCALREAVAKGFVQGPELLISGKQLTVSKAHFPGFSLEPAGPGQVRKAIRDLVWWNVDFIKIQLSPPIRTLGRNAASVDFTDGELDAAIDEAHNYGVPVHAHLRGPAAIKRFLRAGGDYVVHGTGIDDEGIELMLKYGRVLLPTLLSPSEKPSPELVADRPAEVVELLRQTARTHWAGIRRAWRAGVPIAFSTDSGCLGNHIGQNGREFQNMVEIGMTPLEALRAATSVAAKVTGHSDRIGLIREGYDADLVILEGDPLRNIDNTQKVYMTFAKGRLVYHRDWNF